MKDNKEIRALNPEEEKDISGGMNVGSNDIMNKLKFKMDPAMLKSPLAYGAPIPYSKPITEIIKKKIESKPNTPAAEEFIPNNFENEKNDK